MDTASSSPPNDDALRRDLDRIDRIARLMDAKFGLPFTRIRFGLDALVGLVPGIGDVLASAPTFWMIHRGYRHGARRRVLLRMGANSAIDMVLGSVPLIGDLFDVGYKANIRNARLLRRELEQTLRPVSLRD